MMLMTWVVKSHKVAFFFNPPIYEIISQRGQTTTLDRIKQCETQCPYSKLLESLSPVAGFYV